MRLTVDIPDERPEARILREAEDPERLLLELAFPLLDSPPSEPDHRASVALIRSSPHRFRTKEEVDAHLSAHRDDW